MRGVGLFSSAMIPRLRDDSERLARTRGAEKRPLFHTVEQAFRRFRNGFGLADRRVDKARRVPTSPRRYELGKVFSSIWSTGKPFLRHLLGKSEWNSVKARQR